MSKPAATGGADDGADGHQLDWFHILDVIVWVAVGVIGILAAEWLLGKIVRDKIAAGASRYLQRVTPDASSD